MTTAPSDPAWWAANGAADIHTDGVWVRRPGWGPSAAVLGLNAALFAAAKWPYDAARFADGGALFDTWEQEKVDGGARALMDNYFGPRRAAGPPGGAGGAARAVLVSRVSRRSLRLDPNRPLFVLLRQVSVESVACPVVMARSLPTAAVRAPPAVRGQKKAQP